MAVAFGLSAFASGPATGIGAIVFFSLLFVGGVFLMRHIPRRVKRVELATGGWFDPHHSDIVCQWNVHNRLSAIFRGSGTITIYRTSAGIYIVKYPGAELAIRLYGVLPIHTGIGLQYTHEERELPALVDMMTKLNGRRLARRTFPEDYRNWELRNEAAQR